MRFGGWRLRHGLAVLLAVSAGALSGCAELGSGAHACRLVPVASLPLVRSSHVVVEGKLNQQPARFVLDTGAEASHVTPWAVTQFNLARSRSDPTQITGVGGTLLAENVFAGIELGGSEVRRVVPVVGLPMRPADGPPYAGLLGADLLSQYDVEISFPDRRVRLWDADGCSGDYTGWSDTHWSVPLHRTTGGRLQLQVGLDGTPLMALLDSGANVSIITEPAARRLGLTPALLEADRPGRGQGVDGNQLGSRLHRFASMTIGPERLERPRLVVSTATVQQADMLLGADWMRARRVWISWSSRQVFVQPGLALPPASVVAEAAR